MSTKRAFLLAGFLSAAVSAAASGPSAATHVIFVDPNGSSGAVPQYFQNISSTTAGLDVMTVDDSNQPVSSTFPVTVSFPFLFDASGTDVASSVLISFDDFATSMPLNSTSATVVIPPLASGLSGATFRIRTPGGVTGNASLYCFTTDLPGNYGYMGLNILGNVAFTGVSIRNDPAAPGGASTVMTPDRDGFQDAAIIRGVLPGIPGYQIVIYSTSTGDPAHPVQTLYGGNGSPDIYWYGYDNQGRTVPNDTYHVRLQTFSGSIVDDTLTVDVNSGFIRGSLDDALSTAFVKGQVNVFGPGGGGSFQTQGIDNANFELWGFKAGQQLGLQVTAKGYATYTQNNIPVNTDLGTIHMQPGATLAVSVYRSTGAAGTNPEVWGSLSANTTDYAGNAYGSVHFVVDSTSADNGIPVWDTANYALNTVLNILPGRLINLQLNLPQYGTFFRQLMSSGAGLTLPVVFSDTEVVKLPSVNGNIFLPAPAPPPYGTWVSVQGYKNGNNQPSAFGGAFMNTGQTSGNYQVFGVSTGSWVFRTYSQGLKASSQSVTVPDLNDIFGVNFALQTGGVITGTVTLQGDSSTAPPGQSFGGNGCPTPGDIPVSINAWSPATYSGAWTQVCITTGTATSTATYQLTGLDDATYEVYPFLPGFQLNPPGRMTATVSGGAGTLDINYKRLSGVLRLFVQLPLGDVPAQVGWQVDSAFGGGPDSFSRSGSFVGGTTVTLGGMGTGLYQVTVTDGNPGKGLIKRAAAAVVNGSTSPLSVDMRDPTFTASGTVDLSGSIGLPAPWSMTVSTAGALADAAAAHGSTAPVVQAFSFPLPQNFNGVVQPYQEVQAVPVAGQTYATFTVTGLPAGTYLFRVKNDLDAPCPPNCGNGPVQSFPEFGTSSQVVPTTADVTGISLLLSNGSDVSGTLSDATSDSQVRLMELNLRRDDNLIVFQATVTITGGSAAYLFQHISDGNYTLEARERTQTGGPVPKFVSVPARVVVAGGPVVKDVALIQAGAFVGTLRDADSNTLITDFNQSQFLPDNFAFYAKANPWTPGGFAEMERCNGNCQGNGNVFISSVTGQFAIYRVNPGQVYDVVFSGFKDDSGGGAAKGQKTYAPLSLSGLRVEAGQTVDLGTIDLRQGVTLSGRVTLAGSTTPLANVPVAAFPSQLDGGERSDLAVQAFTDQSGAYTLRGISVDRKFYDVVAAPRPDSGNVTALLSGIKYGQETDRNVNVSTPSSRQNVDFSLTPANGTLAGKVVTADGGPLQKPAFGDNQGGFTEARAAITLHLIGSVNNADNPLGEIEGATDLQGNFSVNGLKPGTYLLRAISVGYVTAMKNVVVSAGSNSAGTVTLVKGATLFGGITKADRVTPPSTSEVKMIVGVDQDFQEFVFASLTADASADQVTGYSLEGFKPGLLYSIVAVPKGDKDIVQMATASFASASDVLNLPLIFKPAPPSVFVTQDRVGDTYTVRFFSTHKLRNVTADDNDLTKLVTCPTCGPGTGSILFSSSTISGSRDTVEVVYQAVPSESSFRLKFAFTSAKVDEESGVNFAYANTFEFFAGVDKVRIVRITNTLGGTCSLEGSEAGGEFPPGTFDVTFSSGIDVGVQTTTSTDTTQSFGAPAVRARARALGMGLAARRLGPAAYPTAGLYKAVMAAPDVSQQVFSNFYDIFLPAGISHTLKKDALITLKYDASIADPSALNIYYFDPGNGVYLLEDTKRLVDAVNHSITVAVRHLSTFVVLSGNAPVVGANTYAGTGVQVYNFPNPFNLKSKTVTLSSASGQTSTTEGTVIKYALPPGKSGAVRVDIYDVAGALVRTITEDAPAGGTYYYTDWDGKNDGGKKVASGVYVARFTLNNGDEKFFKMAVIK